MKTLFRSHMALGSLTFWLRSVANALKAGIPIVSAIEKLGRRSSGEIRRLNAALLVQLKNGEDFADAVDKQTDDLPRFVREVVRVGVATGRLPELLLELEKYYRFLHKLRRQFLSQIFWPVLQLVVAIFVIALAIFVMGFLGQDTHGKPYDFIGFGLRGGAGAMIWLTLCFGSLAGAGVAVLILRARTRDTGSFDEWALRIPVLGNCLRTLALARLTVAMRMTFDSAMSLDRAVTLSFNATNNAAFTRVGRRIASDIKAGDVDDLSQAFATHDLFPSDFLDALATAEETGTVPETMGRLASQYEEKSELELHVLSVAVGWVVWAMVAAFIVFLILRIALMYIRLINEFMPK